MLYPLSYSRASVEVYQAAVARSFGRVAHRLPMPGKGTGFRHVRARSAGAHVLYSRQAAAVMVTQRGPTGSGVDRHGF